MRGKDPLCSIMGFIILYYKNFYEKLLLKFLFYWFESVFTFKKLTIIVAASPLFTAFKG